VSESNQWIRFADAEPRKGSPGLMRIWAQREAALDQWRNFNEVYGYGMPDAARERLDQWCDALGLPRGTSMEDVTAFLRRPPRKPKPPKPSPRQYRLKRRAAGSKRRNKGKR